MTTNKDDFKTTYSKTKGFHIIGYNADTDEFSKLHVDENGHIFAKLVGDNGATNIAVAVDTDGTLYTYSETRDGSGNPITATVAGPKLGLDVNVVSGSLSAAVTGVVNIQEAGSGNDLAISAAGALTVNSSDLDIRNLVAATDIVQAKPFGNCIAEGLVTSVASWSKIGYNPSITNAEEDLWSAGGAYVFPLVADGWDVVSSSAGDEDAGTILFTGTCDTGGTATTMLDSGVNFAATAAAGDCIIIDKSGTTPEWGYITAAGNGSVTFSGGLSSGGSCLTARTYQIVDEDAVGKTGAHAVKIEGLDGDYATQSEIVILDGNAAVKTVKVNWFRVNSFRVIAAGSTKKAVGALSLRLEGGAATVYSYITGGFTRARNNMYTVPANKTLYVDEWNAAWGTPNETKVQQLRIYTKANREPSTGFLTGNIFYPYTELLLHNQQINVTFPRPTKLAAKTDIKVSGIATNAAGVGPATSVLRGYLVG